MTASLKKRIWEFVRCTRHNLLDLHQFKISYDGTYWHVTDKDGLHLKFPFYPFNNFHEAEAYLYLNRWEITEGMVVVDGGACMGDFSLYASRKVGKTGRVLMVEPDAANLKEAYELFALNGGLPENVTIIPAGLWHSREVMRFVTGLGQTTYALAPGETTLPNTTVTEIPVESLSSLIEKYDLKRLDMVKLDIEGSEIEVVQSAKEVLDRYKTRFAIAAYHLRDNQKTAVVLQHLFTEFGYQTEIGFPSHLTLWAARNLIA